MKIIKYTYKFKIKPTNIQENLLNKHFGSIRWSYNYFLNQRKKEYFNNKKSITYNQQSAFLTQLKKEKDTIWLKETNAQSLQYSLKCLDQAYQNFFNKKTQFPKFKSKRNKNTFTIPQDVKIKKNKLLIPKFKEGIKIIKHRKIKGKIKKCTLSKTPTNKYFVSILVEKEYTPKQKTNKSVGIDLGLKDFIITSDGLKTKNHRYFKKYQRKLKSNQQHLSRKTKGSNRYERQRLKVARIHEKICNSRLDLIHKTTSDLINNYDIIYLEDLNIKGMSKKCKSKQDEFGKYFPNGQSAKSALNKSINDVSWGKFIETLNYKAKWNNKQVIKIDRFFPSSKTCSYCGYINKELTLKNREWICSDCGERLDRDLNTAINILNEGLRMNISVGTTDYGCGDEIRPDLLGTINETSKKMKLNVSETIKN